MGVWTWSWRTLAALYCLIGMAAGVDQLGVPSTLTLFISVAVLGSLVTLVWSSFEPLRPGSWARVGFEAGAAFVGALGAACLLGSLAFGILAALAVTSPPTLRAMRLFVSTARLGAPRGLADQVGGESGTAAGVTLSRVIRSSSDRDLCAWWRRSFEQLQHAPDSRVALGVVHERAQLLEELERRHPAGIRRWLAAGARPSDDLARFLTAANGAGEPPESLD